MPNWTPTDQEIQIMRNDFMSLGIDYLQSFDNLVRNYKLYKEACSEDGIVAELLVDMNCLVTDFENRHGEEMAEVYWAAIDDVRQLIEPERKD